MDTFPVVGVQYPVQFRLWIMRVLLQYGQNLMVTRGTSVFQVLLDRREI